MLQKIFFSFLAFTVFLFSFSCSFSGQSFAQGFNPTLKEGTFKPRPIAISSFHAENPEHQKLAEDIPTIVRDNLERSGLFRPINPNAFVQTPSSIFREGVRFPEWRATGTETMISGTILTDSKGNTRVEFRLFDVLSEQQLIGMAYRQRRKIGAALRILCRMKFISV